MRRNRSDTPARRPAGAHLMGGSLLAAACALLVLGGCSDDTGGDADDHDVPGVYTAVIRAVAPAKGAALPKNVYIEPLPGTKLSLQDQAAVVKAFADGTTVRFIDDRLEAVDDGAPDDPVRRDGVLLQVNPAQSSGTGTSVKATRYVDRTDQHTVCLQLEETDHVWSVASSQDC